MGLVAVLAETGVPRRLLHLAAGAGVLGDGPVSAAEADARTGDLVDASLLGFTVGGVAVAAHRLVMRVARERLAAGGTLPAVLAAAVRLLTDALSAVGEPWRDPAWVRELAGQVGAVTASQASYLDALTGQALTGLLALRQRAVSLLNILGGSTELVIAAAEPLVTDFEWLLGAEHPDTLTSRGNLATAFRDAGGTDEAVVLFERVLADFERLLGAEHPQTLLWRNNLALAYRAVGRRAEAAALLERVLADSERLLGAEHPDTLMSRNNLATAYQDAGRRAEAVALLERTLADSERLLGAEHPNTKVIRSNLAALTT
jgi:tetratricopeptide (TPR) repeat protein